MSDVNLRWLKEVIRQRDASNDRPKITRTGLIPTQKKLLKYLSSFIILKDLIYFVDEEKLSFAYNTDVNETTKCSPFELMFGRIPKLPIDLVYDQTNAENMRAKYEVRRI